jgi:S1-C subfamily serine protease
MKLIKVAGFLFQFGLIGLALAAIYLVTVSDRSKDEILAFLISSAGPGQTISNGGSAVFSYADAVASSAPSVVTIYTSKTVTEKPHPLLDDPIFSQFFGDQLKRRQRSHSDFAGGRAR